MIARATHRRYANSMDWQLYNKDEKLGIVGTNEKVFADAVGEVLEIMSLGNATHAALIWTAKEGFIGCDNDG